MPQDDDDWTDSIPITQPLGRLKQQAHDLFDPIWQTGLLSRSQAYEVLAAALGVPEPQAHMSVMTRENLIRVPLIARALFLRLKRLNR